ncbi:MAG: DMT family transporter [Pseudomonadota bacterium]
MGYLPIIAVVAGGAIAVQAGMNAQLGALLRNPLLAACIAFAGSVFFTLLALAAYRHEFPSGDMVRSVPPHLWLTGLLSAFGITMFYYLIPKMGVGPMMSFALSGQLVVAMIAGHFGWFDLPVRPFTATKLLGLVALTIGIVLANRE